MSTLASKAIHFSGLVNILAAGNRVDKCHAGTIWRKGGCRWYLHTIKYILRKGDKIFQTSRGQYLKAIAII